MADISKLRVQSTTYDIKDTTARNTANNADGNASQAILDSAEANAKIDGAKIIGTYTSGTETLEVALELGTIGNGGNA